jgi:hypothetical protein
MRIGFMVLHFLVCMFVRCIVSLIRDTQVTQNVNPGGMTMKATCCSAHVFPNDDTVAINYGDICNSAFSMKSMSSLTVWLAVGIVALVQVFWS